MRIKEITNQHRRDFTAIYECEHCEKTQQGRGYDDNNFHRNVIPQIKCQSCGQSAPDTYRALSTKYPQGMQV